MNQNPSEKEDKGGSTCSGFRSRPRKKEKGGQDAPDFATYFATFKGVSICRIVTQNRCKNPKKTNDSTEARGSA